MHELFPYARPGAGFAGGLLIGLAAAVMLFGARRIAGVSGLFARATNLAKSATPQIDAALFIAGLVGGAALYTLVAGPVPARFPPSYIMLALAGLVVGFGTRMGNGCTSGHGVCGLSRLSPRSIAATLTFIAAGVVTVAVTNALGLGW